MRIVRRTLEYRVADPLQFQLISDCHIGGAHTDHKFLKRELKQAASDGCRISVNGDVFDCILTRDLKRYRPEALHPRLQGRSNILNETVKMGVEIFGPFAPYIDMIGCGNHEAAVEKHHNKDMIQDLVEELNTDFGGNIDYGGYSGFIQYRCKRMPGGKGDPSTIFTIYYHHGAGGNAPVTKSMIDFARKSVWIDSDLVWVAHKHHSVGDTTPLQMRCPRQGDQPVFDQQVFVMTGGYLDTLKGQSQQEIMTQGRNASYAEDMGLPPQAKGGARVLVKFHRRSGIENIKLVI